jgi:hypothetical protein
LFSPSSSCVGPREQTRSSFGAEGEPFSNTAYHPVLDWRLARRPALDILLTEHMASDRWDHIRAAAMRVVNRDFSWQVLDARPRPVIDIGMV